MAEDLHWDVTTGTPQKGAAGRGQKDIVVQPVRIHHLHIVSKYHRFEPMKLIFRAEPDLK
ncbi:hypothetical protein EG351_08660 [Chryseobacterium bernardetii]|nr:hypothetical protein EG351_08660 [Chryseobacterium bernardetii]